MNSQRMSTEAVNQLIKEKAIKLVENRYIITNKGKEYRRRLLINSNIDLAEQVEILNEDLKKYSIERMDLINVKQLIEDNFFSEKQKKQIQFCMDNKQPINIGLSKDQAEKLMELSKDL